MLAFDNAGLATAAVRKSQENNNNINNNYDNKNNSVPPLLNSSVHHPSPNSTNPSSYPYTSALSSVTKHDTMPSLKSYDNDPSATLPRRSSISSTHSTNSVGRALSRNRKPPTISTQQNTQFGGNNGYSATSSGSGGKSTPTTPTPRGSIRRKGAPTLPPTPSSNTSPLTLSEAKSHYDLTRSTVAMRGNGDQDVNYELDRTQSMHMNASQSNMYYQYQQQQQLLQQQTDAQSINSRSSKAADIKRRMSLHNPSGLLKNFSNRNKNSNASLVINNTNNISQSPIDYSSSCNTLNNNNGSTMMPYGRGGTMQHDNQSTHSIYPPSHQSKPKSQRLGDLLSKGGSLLGSKKRGSEANMKANIQHFPSSTQSINTVVRDDSASWSFKRKDGGIDPNASKSSLLSRVFGNPGQQSQRLVHQPSRHFSQSVYMAPDSYDSASRGIGPWVTPTVPYDSKIFNWELNKSVPSSDYENESFALWIRPNIQARTVISGAEVENAEKSGYQKYVKKEDEEESSYAEELRKKYFPELEDMKVLEEVLDFVTVILMRASASLYPFIASAHSKSIPFNISWKTLQYREHGFRLFNVRNLKEYQDYVMADIGCAIQAMIEIYDQQERPFGHPDNMNRDVKPHKASTLPVVLPQNRPKINRMASESIVSQHGIGGRAPLLRPSVASLVPSTATSPTTPTSSITSSSPPNKHRRYASIPGARPTLSGMISSIKHSLPSPSSLQSPQQNRNSQESYNTAGYSSYPDGIPFASALPSRAMPMSYTQADSIEHQQSFSYNFNTGTSGSISNGGNNGHGGGKFSQSIQSMLNTFRSNSGSTILSNPSNTYNTNSSSASPTAHAPLSKHEEKRQQLEHRWRVDIMRRKAHLRSWACRRFLDLYNFSLGTESHSLEEEFKDLHRIIQAIVEVDSNASERSHDLLASKIAKAREQEAEQFKLRYSQYKTKAPTGKEIQNANNEANKRFEADYAECTGLGRTVSPPSSNSDEEDNLSLKLDDCVAPLRRPILYSRESSSDSQGSFDYYPSSPTTSDIVCSSAYDCMEFYGLQGHPVWEPLLDRLSKFDTTHHELDARNIFQFLRRMNLYSPGVNDYNHLLSDEARDEMLAVLWVIEKCVCERPDYQQSPTWFRLSSSASAVQAVCTAGGVIPYLKELRDKDPQGRDPILTVHPVTLTGYFKRLLKESGGLLLKETTGLFVELARPATDNGDFWNLEKLSRIDRALLYRVICLDMNRGQVFLRISRVMDQILKSSPKDMELDAFALSKMVQVVELSGVLDLKALRRWNGAWSAIILGYM